MKLKHVFPAVLMLAVFYIAGCGDDSSSSSNSNDDVKNLNATVRSSGEYGTLTVTNKDSFAYQHLSVHLNETGMFDDGYFVNAADIAPGQSQSFNLSDFAKSDGTRFQIAQVKIVKITVETKDDKDHLDGFAEFNGN